MVDVFEVADLLVAHAVASHADEVDLIAYYGSYAKGTAGPRSDLDIFYTPAGGKDPPIAKTCLVAGTLFDFWPVRWDRLEAWANGLDGAWSRYAGVVHHARLLHARGEEQASRLAGLKRRVLDLQKPPARRGMVRRALGAFPSVLAHLGNLRLAVGGGDFADVRHAGWMVVGAVRECLALANQVLLDQPGKEFLEQLALLEARPADLERLVVTIGTSADADAVAAAAERLAAASRAVLRDLQADLPAERQVADAFAGAYPEIRAGLDKVLSACERGDALAAGLAAWFSQYDLSLMLSALHSGQGHADFNLYGEFASCYREIGLPELMRPTAGDLAGLAELAEQLDRRVRQWLTAGAVGLEEFATLEDFRRDLRGPSSGPAAVE